MNILNLLKSQYTSMIFGGLAGIVTAWVTQRILNKRGVFSYFVNHNRVGFSSDDKVFGKVSVTWNDNPVRNLYFSTIELKNESLNDYENVTIKAYTADTLLLSDHAVLVDSPDILKWSPEFNQMLYVEPGKKPSEIQQDVYNSKREYLIPVFNRGQVVRISYINSANTDKVPSIWLSANVKGVRVRLKTPQKQIFGVSQPIAAIAGVMIGLFGIIPLAVFIKTNWIIAIIAMVFGFIAQIPGAFTVKCIRKLREIIGG